MMMTDMSDKIKAVIVDDEQAARFNIKDSLNQHSHWQVVGEASNGREELSVIHHTCPDVVFLDIQMPLCDGISLTKQLLQHENCPIIIFVTAYDEYAVQAFELYALDYILKPFDNPRFDDTLKRVEQALKQPENRHIIRQNNTAYTSENYLNRLVLRSAGSIKLIDIASVHWFSSESNYVAIHHTEGVHLHRVTLSFLEQHLDPGVFVRTHRTALLDWISVVKLKLSQKIDRSLH